MALLYILLINNHNMELISGLILGMSLSAASGFRLFIPFVVLSLAAYFGLIDLKEGSHWISTYQALITFSGLTLLEIAGFYSPWIDNMLDLIATPVSIITGSLLAGLVLHANPVLLWVFAIILGGGSALNVQLLTVKARALSSVFKSGRGNPIVSTIELFSSILISVIAIFLPVLSFLLTLVIIYMIYIKIVKQRETAVENG